MDASISNMPIVKITIAAVRAMWDSRNEKSFYDKMNWLDGMDSEYFDVLSMLFSNYGVGEENIKTFAKRIASI
ncbi:MAG TPA: hypothetical protein PKZ75_15380 [Bacteroidia bacterium]|jgi:hypothetical protein|nr:hypothetical protein [Bacteroidia bacterium]